MYAGHVFSSATFSSGNKVCSGITLTEHEELMSNSEGQHDMSWFLEVTCTVYQEPAVNQLTYLTP